MESIKEMLNGNSGKKIRLLILLIIIVAAVFVFFTRTGDDDITLDKEGVQSEEISDKSKGSGNVNDSHSNSETSSDVVICDVSGAVKQPKVVELKKGSRIGDAIDAAGGLTNKADITNINRAAVVNDGDKILIPETGAEQRNEAVQPASSQGTQGSDSSSSVSEGSSAGSSDGKISLNSADSSTLQQINGVGPVTAEKIIAYRNQNGGFTKLEQLKEINGIGDKTFEKMKDQVCL